MTTTNTFRWFRSSLNSARRNNLRSRWEKAKRIIVGSRASQLALLQAESVISELRKIHLNLEFAIEKITTKGDREYRASLAQIGGQGLFVKELEEALLAGTIDMAVHSLKDVPTEVSPELRLTAMIRREDARDVLVSRSGKGLMELPPGATIGTGSQRRAIQLRACRPDLQVRQLRGNVDTRLRKTYSGELDGVILAAAALLRLAWQDRITEYLPLESFLPAIGQGALAIEIRAGDVEMARLVSPLNHEPTWQSVLAERAFLRYLGGGCRAPIAALGEVAGDVLELQGMVASVDGSRILRTREEGSAATPEQVGKLLAERMLEMGASQFITGDDRW